MNIHRRGFVAGAVGLAASSAATSQPDLSGARADFPWASTQTYLNTATEHPIGLHSSKAMQEYLHALSYGPDSMRDKFENGHMMAEVKNMFAALVHAKPSEIGFTPSTQTGENIVIDGNIRVTVVAQQGGKIRLGIEAPDDVPISRAELGVCAGRRETPQRCFSVRCRT